MQRTASQPAFYLLREYHPNFMGSRSLILCLVRPDSRNLSEEDAL